MWTVVYIAPTKAIAERVQALLEQESFLVTLKIVELDENDRGTIEVQVPEGEAEEATELIAEHLGRLR
ncbi:hypothetical protein [Sulfobacillus sp. hq2]|uniref:Glutamate decarboxylase n=1 Tax=Sulfobacillus thermotolerans TaxID=338644 RepID=A0ABN5H1D2_9FIRM|nr:hypothetical protein [Sulfobacillus sp. hq2]AUW94430.1 hypothetical protein BXT84_11165 [Sulfobacillus thermotolerans]MCY0907539.1 hypothetical protein [Sulfobacillus thermotolerans]POB09296.1 hypothetical protein CO251_13655 [Sulfobacillus sp. hq2]